MDRKLWSILLCVSIGLFIIGFWEGQKDAMHVFSPCTGNDKAAARSNMAVSETVLYTDIDCDSSGNEVVKPAATFASHLHSSPPQDHQHCPLYSDYGSTSVSKIVLNKVDKRWENSVLNKAFYPIHHPDGPSKAEMIVTAKREKRDGNDVNVIDDYKQCTEVYLTRSGSRGQMPNKCQSVVFANPAQISPHYISHRYGIQANEKDKYVPDYMEGRDYKVEKEQLPLMMSHYQSTIIKFRSLMGNPLQADGTRRTVIVMVANEGVVDLLLNFICSCDEHAANIDIRNIVVFLGDSTYIPLVKEMGVNAFYDEALGYIPPKAAGSYGDGIFGKLMWLKTTSVYIAIQAGFHVIFQDTDLVWIKNPIEHLYAQPYDIAFMDDGARSPRFTPFFINSGFYYMKHNARTVYLMERMLKGGSGEISQTHSHQSVLIRYLTEVHHSFNLALNVLDMFDFPSGALYHHNKTFIKAIQSYTKIPYVFHMCWTSNREDKVKYLKELGMWYLNEEAGAYQSMCVSGDKMIAYMSNMQKNNKKSSYGVIKEACCRVSPYFSHFQKTM